MNNNINPKYSSSGCRLAPCIEPRALKPEVYEYLLSNCTDMFTIDTQINQVMHLQGINPLHNVDFDVVQIGSSQKCLKATFRPKISGNGTYSVMSSDYKSLEEFLEAVRLSGFVKKNTPIANLFPLANKFAIGFLEENKTFADFFPLANKLFSIIRRK